MAKLFCLLLGWCLVIVSCADFGDIYSTYQKNIKTFEKYVDRQQVLKERISDSNALIKEIDEELNRLIRADYVAHFDVIQLHIKRTHAITDQLEADKLDLASIQEYFRTMSLSRLNLIVEYHLSLQDSLFEKYRVASRRQDLRRVLLLRNRMEDSTWYYQYANYLVNKRHPWCISRTSSSFD